MPSAVLSSPELTAAVLQNLRAEHRLSEVRLHCQFAPVFSAQQTERHKPVTFAAVRLQVKTKTQKVFAGRVLFTLPGLANSESTGVQRCTIVQFSITGGF